MESWYFFLYSHLPFSKFKKNDDDYVKKQNKNKIWRVGRRRSWEERMSSSSFLLPPHPFPSSTTHNHRHRQISLRSLTITSSSNKKQPSSWVSPDWLTSLTKSLTSFGPKDDSNIPIATAKLDDVSELLGGALFLPLFKWMNQYGPIYRLAAGPRNFVIVSDPAIAKHVLRNYGTKYGKGLVAEVSEFLFGSGFAIAEGSLWTVIL